MKNDLDPNAVSLYGASQNNGSTLDPNSVRLFQPKTQTPSTPSWNDFQDAAKQTVTEQGLSPAVLPVLLGQAAIESGRGKSAPGNNFFGIKGGGNAGSNNLATQEYGNGGYYGEQSNFAAYSSPKDSINAYLQLIQGYPGVKEAIASGNPDAIIKAVEAGGYATSPTYVQNVENTPEFHQNQLPVIQ